MPKVTNPMEDCLFIGIDPGKKGGIALLTKDSVKIYKMPKTEAGLWQFFRPLYGGLNELRYCCIEKVHSMPGQGVASMFKFGMGYGSVRMAVIAAGIFFVDVTPQCWQRYFNIPPRKKTGKGKHKKFTETKRQYKQRLMRFAQRLFPKLEITLETADALLIAEYARRTHG